MLDDQQLLRYNRQLLLPQIDIAGQEKLANSRIAVIGLGGLGCPAAQYLAAAGVGELVVIDDDIIEISNLQRQLVYTDRDIGQSKARVMARQLMQLNPAIRVTVLDQRFEAHVHHQLIDSCDAVIDATDTISSRKQINSCCVNAGVPLVFAAAIRMEGQLTVFDPRLQHSPCYECVFGHIKVNESCTQGGVLGSVVGTLGIMQATEAIKLVLNIGSVPVGRLLLYDAESSDWRTVKISANPNCPVCASPNFSPGGRR